MAVKIAYLARSSSPAALQAPTHTAQGSASAYEVDRGDGPGRHQRCTKTRAVSSVTGSRRTNDIGVAALLEVRIEDRVAGRAPARLPYLGESAVLQEFI